METLLAYYSGRIKEFNKEIEEQNSTFNKIFYSRIILFFTAFVLFFFFFQSQVLFAYSFGAITVIVFLYLLSLEIKLKRKTNFLKNLIKVNEIEIQLIKKDFNGINEGIEFINKQHHFISDLDIFGRKSVFQILNRTSTYTGRVKLADWLTNPFLDKKKIIQRQTAVKELSTKPEWNHEFIALGFQNKEQAKDKEVIEEWLNEKNTFSNLFLKISSILLPLLSVISIVLYFTGIINETPFTLLFFTQLFIIGSYTKRINKIHDNLSRKFDSIEKYRQLISLIESEKFDSTLLNDLKSIFKKENESASESIKELKKQTDKLDARMNIVVAVLLNGILLWDINIMRRIEKWRNSHKDNFIKWVDAIGEFDAFISLGMYAHNNPDYIFPEVETDHFVIEAENIGHPLLNEKILIKNNYHISHAPKVDLLTGANMAGKSTFLRTVGVNLTIAMIGAPVCASRYKFSPIHLFTSLRTNDSLQENESFFYAELKRLHLLTEQYEQGRQVFFLLDEILKGTNSKDQHAGSEALIKKILRLNGVGIVATHDVELSKLSSEFSEKVRNLRFEITIKANKLNFDYKLSEGVCSTMNASFLMKSMGIVD
jgi:DNA mismatch repair ATPase MutS